jgi:hypothetical protein
MPNADRHKGRLWRLRGITTVSQRSCCRWAVTLTCRSNGRGKSAMRRVDFKIVVNDAIAHSVHQIPGDMRVTRRKLGVGSASFLGSLTYNFDTANHSVLRARIAFESRDIHALDVTRGSVDRLKYARLADTLG